MFKSFHDLEQKLQKMQLKFIQNFLNFVSNIGEVVKIT